MKWQLDSMARSWIDVSRFKGSILNMDNTISNLEKSVWVQSNWNTTAPKKTALPMSNDATNLLNYINSVIKK
jgi:hypothetical protein